MNIILELLTYFAGGIGGIYFMRDRRFLIAYLWIFCAGQVSVNVRAEEYNKAAIDLASFLIMFCLLSSGEWLYRRHGGSAPPSNNKP